MKQNFVAGGLYVGWARQEEIKHRQTVEEINRLSGDRTHSKTDRWPSALRVKKEGRAGEGIGPGAENLAP